MKKILIAAALFFLLFGTARAAKTYTYIDLVSKLVDLEGLAVLPETGENADQWSSYDRGSYYDAEKGVYVGWDANGDGGGIIRKEGDLSVMAEMEGPGVIWRIWSAAVGEGHVKIYLDGSKEPAVDLLFSGYFNLKNPPFVYPALVHNAASGWNSYIPIPYKKSCKIVAENGWGNYYHFTYQTFPKGTVVPTFRRDLSDEEKAALQRADDFLKYRLGTDPAGERRGAVTVKKTIQSPAEKTVTVLKLEGARAITGIKVKLNLEKDEITKKMLRSLALRISWDGSASPSVWAPLGDFFGTAPGFNKYKSLPLGMTDDFFYSYWYMPFAKGALIELQNDGKTDVPIEFEITHAPLTEPISELGRFHAKWHGDAFPPKEKERRAIDWTLLTTKGRGRFVGVMLHVMNPVGGWWGEGDEKFFVDGEKFPSFIGTGSEDYFGYAWCNPGLFQNAYHNQTYNQASNAGNVSVNRWHITDNVPFQKSFEADIEKYYPNKLPTLYAAVAYWYQAANGEDLYGPVAVAERTGYYDTVPYFAPGAIEGERLKVLACSAGTAERQPLRHLEGQWSAYAQLLWTGASPGAKLDMGVRVSEAGKYELKAQFTKAPDYGIFQLYLDDQKLGGPIDLYSDKVMPGGEVSLGALDLSEGEHKLTAEVVGANEKAAKGYIFGLDYIKLVR